MRPSPNLDLAPQLGMVPTAALVAYSQLLALPGAELEQAVTLELSRNPALIMDEPGQCGGCGLPAEPPCPYCRAETLRSRAGQPSSSSAVARAPAAPETWTDVLLRDLRLALPDRDAAVAVVVVASLDERGYLTGELSELARAARTDTATVTHVLRTLQECGPPGVGARDLRECLLLQIDRLAAAGGVKPVARAIAADHLGALARGAFASIARQLGVSADQVAEARVFIRRELVPRPLLAGCPGGDAADALPVWPDVAVTGQPGQPELLRVDVLEEQRFPVRIDPAFRRVARDEPAISALVRRGDFFLARLRERWATMRRITECVAAERPDILAGEPQADGRLTRSEIAAALGINPSTVSRATAGRYVLLPSRRVLPYAAFFDGSLGVRSQLEHIIAAEGRPLSDSELCVRLQHAGHRVARRTVAKYRSRLRVLPSIHR